jgi:hypothetical protein
MINNEDRFREILRESRKIEYFKKILREGDNSQNSGQLTDQKTGLPILSAYANDIIDTLDNLGKPTADRKHNNYRGKTFYICKTPQTLKNIGITGDYFKIAYDTIFEHYIYRGIKRNDPGHILTGDILKAIANEIDNPFLITKYQTKNRQNNNTFSFFLNIKINNNWTMVGIEVFQKSSANYITTIYGYDLFDKNGNPRSIKYVQYVDWNNVNDKKDIIDLIDMNTINPDVIEKN